jgi:hypothetical protein
LGEPHCSHVETRGAAMPCWARRLSRRDLEVFRFGTAMSGRAVYLLAKQDSAEAESCRLIPAYGGAIP